MPNYRRNYVPGGTYFFTLVTQDRRPILTTPLARRCLRDALELERSKAPFTLDAIVLLPDHLHAIWTLPEGDADYSIRWKRIKEQFTRLFLAGGGTEGKLTANRSNHDERAVWQPRFWEHTVKDEVDFENCFDYLHNNPVKHGLVDRVVAYPWSTFHRYVKAGHYAADWGCGPEMTDVRGAEWD
jgi:putative transposase